MQLLGNAGIGPLKPSMIAEQNKLKRQDPAILRRRQKLVLLSPAPPTSTSHTHRYPRHEHLRRRPRCFTLFKPHWPGGNGSGCTAGTSLRTRCLPVFRQQKLPCSRHSLHTHCTLSPSRPRQILLITVEVHTQTPLCLARRQPPASAGIDPNLTAGGVIAPRA